LTLLGFISDWNMQQMYFHQYHWVQELNFA